MALFSRKAQQHPTSTRLPEVEEGGEIEVVLGREYKDSVSGFIGTAVAEVKFLNGCIRYDLLGKVKEGEEGSPPRAHVVDIQDIVDPTTNKPPYKKKEQPALAAGPLQQEKKRTGGARRTPTGMDSGALRR